MSVVSQSPTVAFAEVTSDKRHHLSKLEPSTSLAQAASCSECDAHSQRLEKRRPSDPFSSDIQEAITALNELLSSSQHQLDITNDPKTGTVIFRIVDIATGDTVLKVPSVSGRDVTDAMMLRRGVLLDTSQ